MNINSKLCQGFIIGILVLSSAFIAENAFAQQLSDIAYNSTNNEYMVVFEEGQEIHGQRFDATGSAVGGEFTIGLSYIDEGPAHDPAIAYNRTTNQYLVVWHSASGSLTAEVEEIHGEVIAADGSGAGGSDFQISFMSAAGTDRSAHNASVAYNDIRNEYMVVFEGNGGTIKNFWEQEIFGQRVSASGGLLGSNFQISQALDNPTSDPDAYDPEIAFNEELGQFLVIWQADGTAGLDDLHVEIFGRRVGPGGGFFGDQFQISNTGASTDERDAGAAAVAYNSQLDEYLATWHADRTTLANDREEIYVQRLGSNGSELNFDFRISDIVPTGNKRDSYHPEIAYNSRNNNFLIVWRASFNGSARIFAQHVSPGGYEIGEEFEIFLTAASASSQSVRSAGESGLAYGIPVVAYNSTANNYLVAIHAGGGTFNEVVSAVTNEATTGDFNGDGLIEFSDIIALARHIVLLIIFGGQALDNADINGDGRVNIFDIFFLVFALFGLIDSLEVDPAISPDINGPMRSQSIAIESASLMPSQVAKVQMVVQEDPLLGIQVGPQGKITYDPGVIHIESITGVEPYRVLVTDIDNEAGEAKFMAIALKAQSQMSEEQIKQGRLVELVVRAVGEIGSETQLTLDADMGADAEGNMLQIVSDPATINIGPPQKLTINRVFAYPNPMHKSGVNFFAVQGAGIQSVQVEIYSLMGNQIFDSGESIGNRLVWRTQNDRGQLIANGVYLYQVTIRGVLGEVIRTEIKKLVILR